MVYLVNQDSENLTRQETLDLLTGKAKPMWTCSTYTPEYWDGILAETVPDEDNWLAFIDEYDAEDAYEGFHHDDGEVDCQLPHTSLTLRMGLEEDRFLIKS